MEFRMPPKPEMLQLIMPVECEELRKYVVHLLDPDPDRALLLTAHLVTERLLGAMIAAALSHPKIWLDNADYRSKMKLARAMGLIGDKELAICRVLNSARNATAHSLEPLPEKWKIELERLAFGPRRKREAQKKDITATLHELIACIAAPWLYIRYHDNLRKLYEQNQHKLQEQHAERWQKIMKRKLGEKPELLALDFHDPEWAAAAVEVELELANELRSFTT